MSRGRAAVLVWLLAAALDPAVAGAQESIATSLRRQQTTEAFSGTYYLPDHFYWYSTSPDKAREKKSLLPLLSPSHAVVGFRWTEATLGREAAGRAQLQEMLKRPPGGLPGIESVTECDRGPTHVAFLLTLRGRGGPGRILSALNALHGHQIFDFVAPVFFLPEKLAYPFPQFEAEFLPQALITGGEAAIKRFNAATHAQVAGIAENTYTLSLPREAASNVLATVLRYLETPWMVKQARLSWRGVQKPLTVRVEVKTPAQVALADLRDPVEYVVTVERDRDVSLVPEMTSESEVKAWMVQALALPDEVVDVKEIRRTTEPINPSRERDRISVVFLFSKAGVFELPPVEVKYTVKDLAGTPKLERLVAGAPFRLTVDEHLPKYVPGIPGAPFTTPASTVRASRPLALAARALAGAGAVSLLVLVLSQAAPRWRERRARARARAAAAMETDTYLTFWERTEQSAAMLALGDADAEKSWLRDVARIVRRIVGFRACGDEAVFLGGAGASTARVREVLRERGETAPEDALALLDELDAMSDVPEPRLTRQRADDFRGRVARLVSEAAR
jgi:hypothetical protein